MTEYTIDSHLSANCILIAEEIEAHANGRAYTDENGDLVILDSEDEPTDEMEYRGLYDFIESANDMFDYQLDRHCSKTDAHVGDPAEGLITS